MKLEKVLRKTRNALIGTGLILTSILGVGCETMNTADWIAFAAGTAARDKNKTEEQRKSAAYLEQIAKEQAQRQHERDIAERSRDETKQEVNVYVENQERQQQALERRGYVFVCNYFKDFDNDGAGNYPDEFVGIKNRFRDNEKILLVSYDQKNKKGELGRIELYNPSGELIHEDEYIFQENEDFYILNTDSSTLTQYGGYGSFKVIWYLNGRYGDSTEFEIVPK